MVANRRRRPSRAPATAPAAARLSRKLDRPWRANICLHAAAMIFRMLNSPSLFSPKVRSSWLASFGAPAETKGIVARSSKKGTGHDRIGPSPRKAEFMLVAAPPPVARRADVLIGRADAAGQCVVTAPSAAASYHMGEQEAFLLHQLDGLRASDEIRTAFAQRFGEGL